MTTETIRDVEIMRVGVWQSANAGKVPITENDLDEVVRAFAATHEEAPVPLKIGHEMRQDVFGELADDVTDGEPAFGWVEDLRRDGERLLATFADVPAKLAALLKAKTWRNRSPEIRYNADLGGKRWPRLLQAVALLGAVPPAIKGMADLFTEGTDVAVALFAEPDDIESIMTELDALRERWEATIYGRRGAPRARAMFEAFKADLKRAARLVATMAEGGTHMKDLTEALGLPEDATRDDVVAAMSEAEAVGKVIGLAGFQFKGADQFVAWLAGKLGVSPDDLAAVAAAVAQAMGLDTPPEDEAVEEPVAASMSDGEAAMAKRLAELEGQVARGEAAKDVDAMIAAGKAVPAQRETLLALRLGNAVQFKAFADTAPVVVHLGEAGTTEGSVDLEPSPDELRVAREHGYDVEALRAYVRAQRS